MVIKSRSIRDVSQELYKFTTGLGGLNYVVWIIMSGFAYEDESDKPLIISLENLKEIFQEYVNTICGVACQHEDFREQRRCAAGTIESFDQASVADINECLANGGNGPEWNKYGLTTIDEVR